MSGGATAFSKMGVRQLNATSWEIDLYFHSSSKKRQSRPGVDNSGRPPPCRKSPPACGNCQGTDSAQLQTHTSIRELQTAMVECLQSPQGNYFEPSFLHSATSSVCEG